MKKGLVNLLWAILGFIVGILLIYVFLFKICSPEDVTGLVYSDSANVSRMSSGVETDSESEDVIDLAFKTAQYIKNGDYASLSSISHPVYGVVFTPYSTVDLASDLCFSNSEIASFGNDDKTYVWGMSNGDDTPIEMTPSAYFSRYVFNRDYTLAPVIGNNYVIQTGNSLENVSEVFPDARFVDLHYPSTDSESHDWSTLRLVYEDYEGELMLVAVIHCEYTV